jgi:predicted secreted hydrolase
MEAPKKITGVRIGTAVIFLCLLGMICLASGYAENGWKQVLGPRTWSFPKDHGAHPEYRTEWWYFTGNLADEHGSRYGYQVTFFRQGIRRQLPRPSNAWDIRDIYMAHFAVTDAARQKFRACDRLSRSGPGLAGASLDGMDVWLLNWRAKMEDSRIRLDARAPGMVLDLRLVPRKRPVIHGKNGFSRKGPAPGQASYYVSLTDLETQGRIRLPGSGPLISAHGISWFDHEFGSNQLAPGQKGWDWFGLHLSDGRDLMIYFLRRNGGQIEPASSGTLVEPDGSQLHLDLSAIDLSILEKWKSPRSKGVYPNRWRVRIPVAGIDLSLTPWAADQELVTGNSTGVIYWEGAVGGEGISRGRSVSCEGYVEMTGYAGNMEGIF